MVDIKNAIGLVVLGLVVAAGVVFTREPCVSKKKTEIVRGGSLSGIIEDGERVKVWDGYYNCRPIRRNDIVLYRYAGRPTPLVKIIKGLPGDKFQLEQEEGGWGIKLNGELLANSRREPYRLAEREARMLALYEKDYQGIIPSDAYLLLGNEASGTLDSTRFGLASRNDILGKVEY